MGEFEISCCALLALAASGLAAAEPSPLTLDQVSDSYVEVALAIGEHDPNYVDAYYGPEETRTKVKAASEDLATLTRRVSELVAAAAAVPWPAAGDADAGMRALRLDYLRHQLASAAARIELLRGRKMSFDEESRALYDAVAPRHDETYFQARLDRIAAVLATLPRLPGEAAPAAGVSLRDQVEALRARVTIPREKLAQVFDRAIAECRSRSARHVALPPGESFVVEQVTDKPWSGYNWYQGGYRSVIQVNVSLPISIDRAIDLACHEGYPGHHLYNALLERELVRGRGWPEFQIYPLFSPQSLIAEGTANYGIELTFPAGERLAFERDVLFPLAGLDPALAAPYAACASCWRNSITQTPKRHGSTSTMPSMPKRLRPGWSAIRSSLPSAQRSECASSTPIAATSSTTAWARTWVRAYVEGRTAGGEPATLVQRKWSAFVELISSPRLPSELSRPQK
jgi:hypothetical protein